MILPKVRDPRLVTIRRGGSLTDSDHHRLALWAASCAEHVLDLFESVQPGTPRTPLARPRASHTSPPTNSAQLPMRSRPSVQPHRKTKASAQDDVSASGSESSFPTRFASSCSTTSA